MTDAKSTLTRPEIVRWRTAVFLTFALSGLAISSWLARLPAVRDHLEVSTSALGIVLFGLAFGSVLGLTVSSVTITRLGTARTVSISFTVGAAGLPVAAVGAELGSPLLTFVGLFLFGFGNGVCDVAMNVAGAANERALGRTVMPLFHASFSLGAVAGVGIGALMELWGVPVLVHLSIVAVLVAAGALTAVRRYQSELTGHEELAARTNDTAIPRSRLGSWGEPRTILIGLIVLGMAFSEGSGNDWLPLALVDGRDFDRASAAAMLGVFLVSMTVGRVAGSGLLDRFGRVLVLRACALLAAGGLAILIAVPGLPFTVLGVVLWGLGSSLGFPVGMSAAADDPLRAAGRVSAVAIIGYIAFLAGPPLIGFLGDHFGLLNAMLVVLALVAVAGLASSSAREEKPAEGAN